jgi:hypothetical protein
MSWLFSDNVIFNRWTGFGKWAGRETLKSIYEEILLKMEFLPNLRRVAGLVSLVHREQILGSKLNVSTHSQVTVEIKSKEVRFIAAET